MFVLLLLYLQLRENHRCKRNLKKDLSKTEMLEEESVYGQEEESVYGQEEESVYG